MSDLLDALDVIAWPNPDAQARTWATLCSRVPWLRGYVRHDGSAREPSPSDPAWTIYLDCDPAYRDARKVVLSGEIDDIVEGRS